MSAPGVDPRELAAMFQQAPPQQDAQGQPAPSPEQQWEKLLEEVLGGQVPGVGYLFADDPEKRQATLVKTNPDAVRDALLRAIEVCAQDVLLPYGAVGKSELAKGALALSQAYLLLDPSVDQEGVPVEAKNEHALRLAAVQAGAQGAAQVDAAHAQADAQARVQAHASGAAFKRAVDENGYVEPPRVQPNPAEQAIAEKHKAQSQELRGARGDKPLPQPRPGQ